GQLPGALHRLDQSHRRLRPPRRLRFRDLHVLNRLTMTLLRFVPLLAFATALLAQAPAPVPPAPALPSEGNTDPSYRLAPGDSVTVNVYSEPDMSAAQRLDTNGVLRLPMIGEVKLAGLSVREAENTLEKLYVSR